MAVPSALSGVVNISLYSATILIGYINTDLQDLTVNLPVPYDINHIPIQALRSKAAVEDPSMQILGGQNFIVGSYSLKIKTQVCRYLEDKLLP